MEEVKWQMEDERFTVKIDFKAEGFQ